MAEKHAPETVWRAEEMYCVERREAGEIAADTGVSEATVKRWVGKYGWNAKREDLAKITATIRADAVKARAYVLQKLLEAEDTKETVQLSYAVSSLEKTALAVEEAARKREAFEKGETAKQVENKNLDTSPATDAERIALLEEALNKQLLFILQNPVTDLAARVRDIKSAMDMLSALRSGDTAKADVITISFMDPE